jgi:hypothetical protein
MLTTLSDTLMDKAEEAKTFGDRTLGLRDIIDLDSRSMRAYYMQTLTTKALPQCDSFSLADGLCACVIALTKTHVGQPSREVQVMGLNRDLREYMSLGYVNWLEETRNDCLRVTPKSNSHRPIRDQQMYLREELSIKLNVCTKFCHVHRKRFPKLSSNQYETLSEKIGAC